MKTTCSACGAVVDGASCSYCGRESDPRDASAAEGELSCPRCPRETLSGRRLDGQSLQACVRCEGLWIPEGCLESLIERAPSAGGEADSEPSRKATEVAYLRCPSCSQLMSRRNHGRVSGVIVDACSEHGLWLDGGELQALRAFVAAGGRERSARAEAEKSARDADFRRRGSGPDEGHTLLRDLARIRLPGGW